MVAQRGCVGGKVYRKDQVTGAGSKQRAPWEEEKISEIQRRKDGKEILENQGQGARTDFPDFV